MGLQSRRQPSDLVETRSARTFLLFAQRVAYPTCNVTGPTCNMTGDPNASLIFDRGGSCRRFG